MTAQAPMALHLDRSTGAAQLEPAQLEPAQPEPALPGVWRWADPAGSDRCGTALATPEGAVLIDPPPLPEQGRGALEREAGPVRHVVLTRAGLASLAAPFRATGVTVWAPAGQASREGQVPARDPGVDRWFGAGDPLPGGLASCVLPGPAGAAAGGEVALFWPHAGAGLLITGDVLPVVGQIPVYREGAALPIDDFRDGIRALLAMEPGTLAPGHQAPTEKEVVQATGYAAHVGRPTHRRLAAPVEGPRFHVPQAVRILEEALAAPVVLRRPGAATAGAWSADPFACTRCGRPNAPAVFTCGGPLIPRLCPECRAERRWQLPAVRIMSCAGGCCTRGGSRAVLSTIRQALAEEGLSDVVDVVPVSCLGECGIGPLVAVATAQGEEPPAAAAFREETLPRVRRYAEEEDETLDEASERVLACFAALIQPGEAECLVKRLAAEDERLAGKKKAAGVRGPAAATEPRTTL